MLDPPPYPAWSHLLSQFLSAAQAVGPGILAGWLAKRRGWVIGLSVGLAGQLAALAALIATLGMEYTKTLDVLWVTGVILYSCITCAAGGAAGVALVARTPPSNSAFEATALKRVASI